MDKNLQKDFMVQQAWGVCASIDIRSCAIECFVPEKIQAFVIALCKLLEVERNGDVNISHGEHVVIMSQLIEKSYIIGTFCKETLTAFLDIVSCKPFNPEDAAQLGKVMLEGASICINSRVRK